jgi:Fe-Mn family superoxide dismutase
LEHISELPERVRIAVRNQGGGAENHTFFWNCMKSYNEHEAHAPAGALAQAIDKQFGSFEKFKEQFGAAAQGRFGSGWVWLVYKNHILSIISTANQDSPVLEGYEPLLGLDVWEHAYYLQYQNRRSTYVEGWWKLVNWEFVTSRYTHAIK